MVVATPLASFMVAAIAVTTLNVGNNLLILLKLIFIRYVVELDFGYLPGLHIVSDLIFPLAKQL